MKRYFLITACVLTVALSGCNSGDPIPEPQDSDLMPVTLDIAFNAGLETDTGYEPMSRAQSTMVKINNFYQYFVVQKQDNGDYLIVDAAATARFTDEVPEWSTEVEIQSGKTYKNVVTSLRPGSYEIIIFSSPYNVTRNFAKMVPGTIIPGPNKPQGDWFAVKYMSWSALGPTKFLIPRELFYGRAPIEVKKTTDLHTASPNVFPMTLTRRTTKFRMILQETTQQDHDDNGTYFFSDVSNLNKNGAVQAYLERQDPSEGAFPWGLDMWGELWYDPNPPASENDGHKFLDHYAYTCKKSWKSIVDGRDYYFASDDTPCTGIFYFCTPGTELKVKTTADIDVWYAQTWPRPIYTAAEHNFTLKNNHITGMVFKMTNQRVPDPEYMGVPFYDSYVMEPVYTNGGTQLLDPATLFEGNIEYAVHPDA